MLPLCSGGGLGAVTPKDGGEAEPGTGTFPMAGVPGTVTTATTGKPRQAGLGEPYTFPHQEKIVGDV